MKKDVSKTIENEAKEQKRGFLCMLGTLAASWLGNMLTGRRVIWAVKGIITAENFLCCIIL